MMRGAKKVHLNLTKQLFLHSFQSIQTSLHSAKLLNGDRVKSAKFTKSQTCHKCEPFLSEKAGFFKLQFRMLLNWTPISHDLDTPFLQSLIELLQSKSLFVWSLASACVIFSIKELAAPFFCIAMLTICKSKHLVTCILIESIPSILCMYMRSHIPLQVESVSNTHFLPKTFRETQNHASFFANYEILFDFWAFVRQYFILFEL